MPTGIPGAPATEVQDIASDADGALWVLGTTSQQAFVLRTTPAGRLDPRFGEAGIVLMSDGVTPALAHALALTSDGILVAWDRSIVRLDELGEIDDAFLPIELDERPELLLVDEPGAAADRSAADGTADRAEVLPILVVSRSDRRRTARSP